MSDTNLDAYKAIGEEGGTDALALVATIMEANAAATERTFQQLYESECEAHARTIEELKSWKTRYYRARSRFMELFDFDPDHGDLGRVVDDE